MGVKVILWVSCRVGVVWSPPGRLPYGIFWSLFLASCCNLMLRPHLFGLFKKAPHQMD